MAATATPQALSDYILELYGVVENPALWPSVLDKFADFVDARGCIVFEWRDDGADRALEGTIMSDGYEPEKLTQYLAALGTYEFEDQDRFEALSLELDAIDLIECNMLFDTEAALLARPNVQAMIANDMRYRAAGLLNKDNRKRARFSVQKSETKGPFTDEDRATMRLLLPHVAKAMEMSRPAMALARTHTMLVEAMDKLRVGVCILDNRGSLVVANREFERQRDTHDVFRVDPRGRLHLHDSADPNRFEQMSRSTQAHGHFGARPRKEAIVTDRDAPSCALCIEIVPLGRMDALGSSDFRGAILYSLDTAIGFDCDPDALRQVFALTDTEAQTAAMLGEGLTNPMIAERRDRSVETVNSQVKALLAKTGCGTRAEFVRLLLGFGTEYIDRHVGASHTDGTGGPAQG